MNAGGDSNGFKVGGFARAPQTVVSPVHIVMNSIAAGNGAHGFYANLPTENNTNNSWNLNGAEMSDVDFESLDIDRRHVNHEIIQI